ncbi:MAG: hypothetical protein LBH07_07995, partial [Treponema sp.]|nr:hypothetical protein [Treponema sp.]
MIKLYPKTGTILLLILVSCSSAPKRPAEVFSIQNMIETLLTRANKEADQGSFTEALTMLDEAWRLAVITDRPSLLIRVNLARANSLFSLDRTSEAEKLWQDAEKEAVSSGETLLASVCRIYKTRSLFISGKLNPEETLNLVLHEQDILKKDKLYSALTWTVKGMAEKELGRYTEAEKSVMNALAIHEKNRYLEQAAYDWYL